MNTRKEYMYVYGQMYAVIDHYLPKPMSAPALNNAAQAPLNYLSTALKQVMVNKDFDHVMFGGLACQLPSDGGFPDPSTKIPNSEEQGQFYLGWYAQREVLALSKLPSDIEAKAP